MDRPHERERRYRVDRRDLAIGEKYEMGSTKNRTQARRLAKNHLREHPTYYDVLPVAEREMEARERSIKPLKKKKKRVVRQPQSNLPPGWSNTPWSK